MNPTAVNRRWWTRRRRTVAWLLVVLIACVAGFAAVYRVTVHTITGRVFEDAALRGAAWGANRGADSFSVVLDVITVTSITATLALVALIALIRMRRTQGLAAIALLILANVSSRILKVYVLPRDDLGLDESAPATLNSLPSGHMTAAFAIGAALMIVLPGALRTLTAVLTVAGASAVAVATMATGWHRPGDSAASFLLVTAWVAAIGLVLVAFDPSIGTRPMPSAADAAIRRLLAILGLALMVPAGLSALALALWAALRESSRGPALAFASASLLLVAMAMVSTAVVLGIVARTEAVPPGRPSSVPPGRPISGGTTSPSPSPTRTSTPRPAPAPEQPTRVDSGDLTTGTEARQPRPGQG